MLFHLANADIGHCLHTSRWSDCIVMIIVMIIMIVIKIMIIMMIKIMIIIILINSLS